MATISNIHLTPHLSSLPPPRALIATAVDARDPEYSILKNRLERHVAAVGVRCEELTLERLTALAEEAITQVRARRPPALPNTRRCRVSYRFGH